MKKIILLLSITICGWLAWWLTAGFGIMTAYFFSVIGSLIGVILGVLFNRRFRD